MQTCYIGFRLQMWSRAPGSALELIKQSKINKKSKINQNTM
jgi:hypothetical protein